MRKSIGRFFLIFALVMSVVAVQNVFAEDLTIEGQITAISEDPNIITIMDENGVETDVYGVRLDYIANKYPEIYKILMNEGVIVTVWYYVTYCNLHEEDIYMATEIEVSGVTIPMHKTH